MNDASVDSFEELSAKHLRSFFKDQYEVLGHAAVRSLIRAGRAQASRYGFRTRREVQMYIDLTFVFGPSFDTDRALPWASMILQDEVEDRSILIERLYSAAIEHMHEAAVELVSPDLDRG